MRSVMAAMESMRYAAAPMDKNKPGAEEPSAAPGGGGSMFWWGITAGVAITALVFHRPLLTLARDGFTNVVPIFFSPGVLEITLGLVGFGVVILINYWLLRKEARDEWVVLQKEEE